MSGIDAEYKLEHWQAKDGQHYWHVKAPNHEVVAQGEGYKNRQDLLDQMASLWPSLPPHEIDDPNA